jgi:hypothetical protein
MERITLKTLCLAVALAALVAAPALTAYADEPPAAKPAAAAGTAAPPAGAAPTAEEQKMMAAMMKAGTPGKPHQELAKQAGNWDLAVKAWMKPGAPPQESKGTAERTMILGGRVLTEKVNGDPMGGMGPFEGFGLSGYDNVSGKYWGTWTDNMGTGVMMSTGTCSEKTSTCTFKGSYVDAVTKKTKHNRMVDHWDGADKSVVTFYETGKNGKEAKTLEITYTRKK